MQTRPLRTRSLLPEDRDAELEAAHRRARAAMAEVNRLARPARIRAGLEEPDVNWALIGVAGATVAALAVWWWRGREKKPPMLGLRVARLRGLDVLLAG